jgi:hypothetical protein
MIALMVQVVSTSEMSVSFYDITRRNIPDYCHLLRQILIFQRADECKKVQVPYTARMGEHRLQGLY